MRIFLLLFISTVVVNIAFAQLKDDDFDSSINSNPLYIFAEDGRNDEDKFLLEKKIFASPDDYSDNPIGLSLSNFKTITLQKNSNNCSFFTSEDEAFARFLDVDFSQQPELDFFEDRLYSVRFYFAIENGSKKNSFIKSLSSKFGKALKSKYKNSVKVYTWEGYKINVILIEEGNEQTLVFEDILMKKLATADLENKTFVKEEKLYSDIETLLRNK